MDQKTTGGFSGMLRATLDFIRQMLLAPAAQLRDMEKSGGFTEPVLLIVRLGLLAGVVRIFVTFYHMANGASVGLLRALSAVLFVPVSLLAISYIAAFLLWLVMRLLGRDSDLETAFRVVAHLCALAPVAVLALAIPYLGNLLLFAALAYLLVIAAIEVYQLGSNTAWAVFGVGCALLALFAVAAEYRARQPQSCCPVAVELVQEAAPRS